MNVCEYGSPMKNFELVGRTGPCRVVDTAEYRRGTLTGIVFGAAADLGEKQRDT